MFMNQSLTVRYVVGGFLLASMSCGLDDPASGGSVDHDLVAAPKANASETEPAATDAKAQDADVGTKPGRKSPGPGNVETSETTVATKPGGKPGPASAGTDGETKDPRKPSEKSDPTKVDTGGEATSCQGGEPPAVCTVLTLTASGCVGGVELKQHAEKLCDTLGTTVGALKVADDFGCKGSAAEAWVSCCSSAKTPSKGQTGQCTVGMLGDDKACLELSSIKLKTLAACDAEGAELVQLSTDEQGCPAGSARAKFACCSAGASLEAQ